MKPAGADRVRELSEDMADNSAVAKGKSPDCDGKATPKLNWFVYDVR